MELLVTGFGLNHRFVNHWVGLAVLFESRQPASPSVEFVLQSCSSDHSAEHIQRTEPTDLNSISHVQFFGFNLWIAAGVSLFLWCI